MASSGAFPRALASIPASNLVFNLLSDLVSALASVFASVLVLSTIFALVLFLRPEKFVKKMSQENNTFSIIVYSSILAGFLGMLLNDSGVAIPGMMISIIVPALTLLAIEQKERNSDLSPIQ